MNTLRNALRASGLNPSEDPLHAFFIGRNPV
jgi:4-hydroxy-tetrahydrodipicolinate synthase